MIIPVTVNIKIEPSRHALWNGCIFTTRMAWWKTQFQSGLLFFQTLIGLCFWTSGYLYTDIYKTAPWWSDRALKKSALKVRSRHLNISSDDHITFDSIIVPKLWIPDLVFLGTTNEKRHTVIRNNDMLRVTPRGQILLSQRFTLEMDCHMDFHQFPFDYQLCPIELESFGYTTKGTDWSCFSLLSGHIK